MGEIPPIDGSVHIYIHFSEEWHHALHYVIKNKILIPNCLPTCQNFNNGYVLDNGKVIVHAKYELSTRRRTNNAAIIRNFYLLAAIFIFTLSNKGRNTLNN